MTRAVHDGWLYSNDEGIMAPGGWEKEGDVSWVLVGKSLMALFV